MRALGPLAHLWALPNSLLGLLLGLLSFQRPRLEAGVLVFDRGPRGFLRAFGAAGWSAITLGHVVLATRRLEGSLLVHESAHVRQQELLGPFFLPCYLLLHAFCGYAGNPFERQAVRAEDLRPAGRPGVPA